ncbi:hypothetical protein D9Q98_005193 [Chlorella vulgaris]|uniref:Uncharacterized protein n=1 Tax=Chlorella vulgaris TaxID=3077 RepID=A0A9D4YWR4_CHLVU|nr:hypothetical protein D9Q98_005193 [Chlorella vulgaris]
MLRRSVALLLLAAQLATAQFPNFANPGGPPFLNGAVYELDEGDPTLTNVDLTGFFLNDTYTLTTTGPDGLSTLFGRYLSWECGTDPGSYVAAVETSMMSPDGTSTSRIMCEYGLMDIADVSAGGTNTWTTSDEGCPTSADEGLLLRYFPTFPKDSSACGSASAPDSAPAPDEGSAFDAAPALAPAPAPEDVVLFGANPTAAPVPAPAVESPLVLGAGGVLQSAASTADELAPCLLGCLADDDFKPVCVTSGVDPTAPSFVAPNKCAMRCQEKHSASPANKQLTSSKLSLKDKQYCKQNAAAIYVAQSLLAPQCTAC